MRRLWLASLVGFVAWACPANAEEMLSEVKTDASKLPVVHEVKAPGKGYLRVVPAVKPKGYTLWVDFQGLPEGASNSETGEARVPQGETKLTVKDRWGKKLTGPLELHFLFSPELDASEPNDAPEAARAVQPGVHQVALFPRGEKDVLKLTLEEPGYLRCAVKNPPRGLTLWCDISDSLGRKRGTNHARIDFAGETTIVVRDRWDKFSSPEPFDLEITRSPATDFLEPNDSPATATPVELGQWYYTALAPESDSDYFKVNVGKMGALLVEATDAPMELRWTIHDLEGKELPPGGPPFVVSEGAFLVRLRTRWGRKSSDEPFPVRIRWAEAGDALEPNNETPAKIELGRDYLIRLPGGDIDRLVAEAPGPGTVAFQALGTAPAGAEFQFGDGEKKITGMPLAVRAETAGPVAVALVPKGEGSVAPFLIRAVWAPDDDANEPNNSRETATALAPGTPARFLAYPSHDVDWFVFEAKAAGYAVAMVQDSLYSKAEVQPKLELTLADSQGKEVASLRGNETTDGLTFGPVGIPGPGRYYLCVRTDDRVSRQPLTLRLLLSGVPTAGSSAGGTDLYLIGVELREDVAGTMQIMANEAGGTYLNADKVAQISEKLHEAVETAVAKVVKKAAEAEGDEAKESEKADESESVSHATTVTVTSVPPAAPDPPVARQPGPGAPTGLILFIVLVGVVLALVILVRSKRKNGE